MKFNQSGFTTIVCFLPNEEFKKLEKKKETIKKKSDRFNSRIVRNLIEKYNRGEVEL